MDFAPAATPHTTAKAWSLVVAQFVLLIGIVAVPPDDVWKVSATAAKIADVLGFMGLVVLGIGLIGLGRSLTPLPVPLPNAQLKSGGVYRVVRHPIYSGIVLWALASAATSGSPITLSMAVALVALLSAKARFEERLLRVHFADYNDYAIHTPRFVPFWPLGSDRRQRECRRA